MYGSLYFWAGDTEVVWLILVGLSVGLASKHVWWHFRPRTRRAQATASDPMHQRPPGTRGGCADLEQTWSSSFRSGMAILNSNTRHSHDRADLDECLEAIPHLSLIHISEPTRPY